MYEFCYDKLNPCRQDKMKLHYMDTDSFVLSFDTDYEQLVDFSKQNKDEFDFSEIIPKHVLYDTSNKEVFGKMKLETSRVLMLDSFIALRSKSYSYSYANEIKQKANQKRAHHTMKTTHSVCFTTRSTNYSIRSKLPHLPMEKPDKLALNPFDDKRMYQNSIKSLPWDKHTH